MAYANVPGDEFSRLKIPSWMGPNITLGHAVAGLGDINGDSFEDVAVGVPGHDSLSGGIRTIRCDASGMMDHVSTNLAPWTDPFDHLGCGIAYLGDLDGAGPAAYALAIGAYGDDDVAPQNGAVYIIFFSSSGSRLPGSVGYDGLDVHTKLSALSPELPTTLNKFGYSVAAIGDVNGDGIVDLAVGEPYGDGGSDQAGGVWILFLDTDGTLKSPYYQKISSTQGGFTGTLDSIDQFGWSVTELGDLDGDLVPDIAVGAIGDDDGNLDRGAVYVLFLNSDGTVKAHQKISALDGGFTGTPWDRFGFS